MVAAATDAVVMRSVRHGEIILLYRMNDDGLLLNGTAPYVKTPRCGVSGVKGSDAGSIKMCQLEHIK